MTAPERIWAGEGEYWDKPHVTNPTAEYILHTRAALAASPLVQEIVAEAVKAERDECVAVIEDREDYLRNATEWPGAEKYLTSLKYGVLELRTLACRVRALSSSPVAVSIAPETDAKPQGRWCWACRRHEVQTDGWCRKCGSMTGQPQEKGE